MLNRPDELRRLEQRIVSSGVEPSVAAAELDDMKFPQLQIAPIDVGNLQFAASRRAQLGGDVQHGIVVEIKPGNRPIRQKLSRLFDDVDGAASFVELYHAVLAWLVEVIGEYGRAIFPRCSLGKLGAKPVAVEHVIAEDQRNAITADKGPPQDKGMGKPDRLFLDDVIELDAPGRSITKQALIKRLMFAC